MITYREELLADSLEEMIPLFEEHHLEVDLFKESIFINPDYEAFLKVEEQGNLSLCVVRDDGELIGYSLAMVHNHLHYKDHIYANITLLFILPEYRHLGYAADLLLHHQEVLKNKDVSVISVTMKEDHKFESLMQSLGYQKAEICYSKLVL